MDDRKRLDLTMTLFVVAIVGCLVAGPILQNLAGARVAFLVPTLLGVGLWGRHIARAMISTIQHG